MKYTTAELDAMPVGTVLRNRRRVLWVKVWRIHTRGYTIGFPAEWRRIEYCSHLVRFVARDTNGNEVHYHNFTHRTDPAPLAAELSKESK